MTERAEALVWAGIYGFAGGWAAVGWQEATDAGHTDWGWLFAGFTLSAIPVYLALQWRQLLG